MLSWRWGNCPRELRQWCKQDFVIGEVQIVTGAGTIYPLSLLPSVSCPYAISYKLTYMIIITYIFFWRGHSTMSPLVTSLLSGEMSGKLLWGDCPEVWLGKIFREGGFHGGISGRFFEGNAWGFVLGFFWKISRGNVREWMSMGIAPRPAKRISEITM